MLQVKNIRVHFGDLPVLDDISFSVGESEIVAIMGPSGCGKSTLFHIIAGMEHRFEGEVKARKDSMSFVFQDDRLLPWRTVWENIALVRDKEDEAAIRKLISDVGLEGFEKYRPEQLSGGMKKRCSLARAFYYKNDILLMDEPFQGLDYFLRQEMFRMVEKLWNEYRQTILFITHEMDDAFTIAQRIIVCSNRPTRILRDITLPPHEERKARAMEMTALREEILDLIMQQEESKR